MMQANQVFEKIDQTSSFEIALYIQVKNEQWCKHSLELAYECMQSFNKYFFRSFFFWLLIEIVLIRFSIKKNTNNSYE